MIDNEEEYRRMYEVERKLWWYKSLHGRVVEEIQRHFGGFRPDLKILDAACGTGGLLSVLKDKGYSGASGFDYSRHAVAFSARRGLDVDSGDLRNIRAFRPGDTYDVICCNDALYFLTDQEITEALTVFGERLHPGGVLLINIHAFNQFAGTHDLAVGSTRRFTFNDFRQYARDAGLQVKYRTYWPFLLSLPILVVRTWQRMRIRSGALGAETPGSDVSYPGDFTNGLLSSVTSLEKKVLRRAPFGSSLFMVMTR